MNIKKLLAVGIILLFIGMAVAPSITAYNSSLINTIYVDDNNTEGPWDGSQEHPYQFIQDGIDNASDGGTVFVNSGFYNKSITIDISITLEGENTTTTKIQGEQNKHVVIIDADYVVITGFTIEGLYNGTSLYGICGIWSYNHSNILIKNNYVSKNLYGISPNAGSNITIKHNTITNNAGGIYTSFCENVIVATNDITLNLEGITLFNSPKITIENNTFLHGGITLYAEQLHYLNEYTISNNTANDQPIRFFSNIHEPIDIPQDAAQLIIVNCSHLNIDSLNFTNMDTAIQLLFSNTITLSNNSLSHNICNIQMRQSSHCHITQNTITLGQSPTTLLFSDKEARGIYLYNCSNNLIEHNNITYLDSGIYLFRSTDNIIQYNSLAHNSLFQQLLNPYSAICLSSSDKNTIQYNHLTQNKLGIDIVGDYNIITHNTFKRNLRHARFRGASTGNTWDANYWNRPRLLPKLIFDAFEVYFFRPRINIDWHPAKEPYDMGG